TVTQPSAATSALGMSAQSGRVATETRPGTASGVEARGELPEAEVKAEMQQVAVLKDAEFRQELDKLRETVQADAVVETRVAASVFVASTGLSVGYVLWLLRGGALLASLLSSLPAWRLVDPLPVLGRVGGGEDDSDDESLQELVAQEGRAEETPEDNTPDANRGGRWTNNTRSETT
ncbi:MAG: hypothetical protein ACREVS_14085, partial [Burkholderiales bacterium]